MNGAIAEPCAITIRTPSSAITSSRGRSQTFLRWSRKLHISLMTARLARAGCGRTPAAGPAATGSDPWVKVPKASTACYSGQDKYFDELGAATDAMTKELYKQTEINGKIQHTTPFR